MPIKEAHAYKEKEGTALRRHVWEEKIGKRTSAASTVRKHNWLTKIPSYFRNRNKY